ncbi:DUF723 domain-containing protein [Acinetobacter baumannii]
MTANNSKVIASAMQSKKINRKINTDIAINDFISIHGNKYDYSKFIYLRSMEKSTIICPIHGEFLQSHYNHFIKKAGCPKCAGRNRTKEEIVDVFTKKHGSRYSYENLIPCKDSEKLEIICKYHGSFWMHYKQHKNGANCPKCRNLTRGYNKLDTTTILKQFKSIHGDTYSYEKVEYKGIDVPVIITCKIHGDFKQSPYHHRNQNSGCPTCNKTTPYTRSKYIQACKRHGGVSNIYLLKMFSDTECFYKVGITTHSIAQRYSSTKMPYSYEIIKCISGEAGLIWELEKKLIFVLHPYHIVPDYKFGGSKMECFREIPKPAIDLIDEFISAN